MFVQFTLLNGETRPALITHAYDFAPPEADQPGEAISKAIWDRRHEGVADLVVFLDVTRDRPGEAFPGTEKPLGGLLLSLQQVVYDATGKPLTYADPTGGAVPPSPSPEFLAAVDQAQSQNLTLAQARQKKATAGAIGIN